MKKTGIAAILAGAAIALWCFSVSRKEAASIGVIGGADGPAAIFVTGAAFHPAALAGAAAGVIAVMIGVVLILRRRR